MMEIEKKLAATDLNKYKTDDLEELIKQLYKYQKFKFDAIISKIDMRSYSLKTVQSYFTLLKRYLKTNVRRVKQNNLYNIIDDLVLTCHPTLTPSESEKCRVYNVKPRKTPTPTPQPTLAEKVEPPKYTEQIPPQYGVWDGETIKLLSNKDVCEGYIKCYKDFAVGKPLVLVKVDFEVV